MVHWSNLNQWSSDEPASSSPRTQAPTEAPSAPFPERPGAQLRHRLGPPSPTRSPPIGRSTRPSAQLTVSSPVGPPPSQHTGGKTLFYSNKLQFLTVNYLQYVNQHQLGQERLHLDTGLKRYSSFTWTMFSCNSPWSLSWVRKRSQAVSFDRRRCEASQRWRMVWTRRYAESLVPECGERKHSGAQKIFYYFQIQQQM